MTHIPARALRRRPWLFVLLAASGGALAQEAAPEAAQPQLQMAQAELQRQFVLDDGDAMMSFAFDELAPQRVVKGAPYCADAVNETVQWLADGSGGSANRIVHQQSTRLCRDGEGRTRQELERGGRKIVYLRDPVARENWLLDPERKTARRLGAVGLHDGAMPDAAALREFAQRMREWAHATADRARAAGAATSPVSPVPPTPPAPVLLAPSEGGPHEMEVKVLRLRGGPEGAAPAEWAVPPPAVQWRAQSLAPRGAGTLSPLGSKDIEGLRANGERTSWVIEAGKVGNEKPIQITREVWTAPDLAVTLLSRDFDPRSGEVNYRLKNVRRGEPDAALMRVPADYARPARPAPRASGPTG